ncbi:MAG: type IV pilus assembly protein PilM [Verrucomicrobiota bacterium]|nr:type IV pilus assembly protein PilM [Verrucomicrobiota bacterium]
MAGSTRIVSLNLGSQTIGLAEFIAQPNGGLALNGFRFREILDAGSDEMRAGQIAIAIHELAEELYLKHRSVNYAIAAQSIFTRFVKLPAVEEEKIERIITFEAQQNVPFPIDEVVWDYQLVGGGVEEQIQVVIVAIKADLIGQINGAVESAGLRTNLVGVASMALYNAFRYNYSELAGCSLLVDIGARTTNLIFAEPGKIFSRSVAIAGGSLSLAIAKEFGEPTAAAELRKKRDGFVSLGGTYAEPADGDVARVSKIIRTTMARLHAEIMRSINYYRSQQEGSAPVRIFLCGGTAGMPYLREFFHEKLQLPVELFNPLRNVAVSGLVDATQVGRSAHLLGELVGLAARSATTCPIELNLRPAPVVARQAMERRRPFFILAAACILLTLLAWAIYFDHTARLLSHATDRLENKIDLMKRVETQINQVRKQSTTLEAAAAPLVAAIDDRSFWLRLIEDLNERLPKEDIWITELVGTSGGKPLAGEPRANAAEPVPTPGATVPARTAAKTPVIDGILVRGLYLSNPKQQEIVVDYFRNLVGSPLLVIDPKNQAKALKPTTPNTTEWAFPYELDLDLRKPLALP